MHAEIISVGTELTSGQNLDTNSQWLSLQLAALGIPVSFHTTVSDNLDDNIAAIRTAVARCGLIIITGGLGPTLDDLTREALAKVASVELTFDQSVFDQIQEMFHSRNRAMPERNRVQALFPAGSEPLPNVLGTAPGIWMKIGSSWIAALPGVPREMTEMFEKTVRPRLQTMGLGRGVIIERRINAFGAGESHIESLLNDLTARGRIPEVGITVSDATIRLRILAQAAGESEARQLIEPTETLIQQRLGKLVYGVDNDELQDVVIRLLAQKKFTVATAESITAGQVAQLLATVPGASEFLKGGVIAYTNAVKQNILGIPDNLIDLHGAVSAPVAEAMAVGCRQVIGSDIAISTTGLAGPSDGGERKPVGLVYVGLAWNGGVTSKELRWFGARSEIQSRTAKSALNELRLWLQKS